VCTVSGTHRRILVGLGFPPSVPHALPRGDCVVRGPAASLPAVAGRPGTCVDQAAAQLRHRAISDAYRGLGSKFIAFGFALILDELARHLRDLDEQLQADTLACVVDCSASRSVITRYSGSGRGSHAYARGSGDPAPRLAYTAAKFRRFLVRASRCPRPCPRVRSPVVTPWRDLYLTPGCRSRVTASTPGAISNSLSALPCSRRRGVAVLALRAGTALFAVAVFALMAGCRPELGPPRDAAATGPLTSTKTVSATASGDPEPSPSPALGEPELGQSESRDGRADAVPAVGTVQSLHAAPLKRSDPGKKEDGVAHPAFVDGAPPPLNPPPLNPPPPTPTPVPPQSKPPSKPPVLTLSSDPEPTQTATPKTDAHS
jgi:hypothetical protein